MVVSFGSGPHPEGRSGSSALEILGDPELHRLLHCMLLIVKNLQDYLWQKPPLPMEFKINPTTKTLSWHIST